jgi:hypothetical protein
MQLVSLLQPVSISIQNDSWQHRHHAPMRAQGGGSGETRQLPFGLTNRGVRLICY